ncbi:tRNA pseudouridine(38-40) synthase TruA [Parvicella tangerina]|uniref:tRNA pseudouridine synthase A n=1 Tax=Parvicella tangerina TaxID=2829795 RepID=A0A916JNG6_9FLAO|nr:tRNA pseudouridine(38-40) synthase TruA [Parvicella tangerina]CAG5083993.1 tRNA pseudouridine synthase A [Parvicella tangerina]
MRYLVEIQYDGTHYHGWQIQPNAITVQETILERLSKIIPQQGLNIVGCGRTDTGVHASQFFFHFDVAEEIDAEQISFKLNHMLPDDIAVKGVVLVADELHARFSAKSRTYHYYLNFQKDPFDRFHTYYYTKELDVEAMNQACKQLFNHKDFTSFSKVKTDTKTNDCIITEAHWQIEGTKIIFTITANRFLRNMVRAIVGTMLEVGEHKLSLDGFNKVIEAKDRGKAGKSVPGHGLFLAKIKY